jgi:adenylosuccinate lyase
MKANVETPTACVFQALLLQFTNAGMKREDAYALVQENPCSASIAESVLDQVLSDPRVTHLERGHHQGHLQL